MALTFIANHCTVIFFHLLIYYNQPHCLSHGSANIDVAFSVSELELQMHRVALLTTNLKTILFIYCTNSQQKLSCDTDDTCYAYYTHKYTIGPDYTLSFTETEQSLRGRHLATRAVTFYLKIEHLFSAATCGSILGSAQ